MTSGQKNGPGGDMDLPGCFPPVPDGQCLASGMRYGDPGVAPGDDPLGPWLGAWDKRMTVSDAANIADVHPKRSMSGALGCIRRASG